MKRIGEFQVVAEIHSGPISRVFRAYQPSLDRVVLVKMLHGRWIGEKDLVERFEREARASARLSHANIVAVHAYGTEGGLPYIGMEFVEGESVRALLTRRGPLPIGVALQIAREVCSGLEAAHGRGVLHRDIKPSNILLSVDGAVKIGDFGLAALLDVGRWEAETAAGTPAYMAPEQLRGEALSGRTDLFSLGATLYEMVTGERAFGGRTPEECLRNVLRGTPPPPERFRPEIPGALSSLILETLAGDPKARPSDAAVLRRALDTLREAHGPQVGREEIAGCLREDGPSGGEAPAAAEPTGVSGPDVPPGEVPVPSEPVDAGGPEPFPTPRSRTPIVAAFLLASVVGVAALIRGGMREEVPTAAGLRENSDRPILYHGPGATEEGPGGWVPGDALGTPAGEEAEAPESLRGGDEQLTSTPPPLRTMPSGDFGFIAMLDVQCTPWAVLYIDGDSVDTTPIKRSIRVASGAHLLELRNPAFPTVRRELHLLPGETRDLRFSLWDQVGRLHITVKPWARIYVDGSYAETTPVQGPIILEPGTHRLRFEHPALEAMGGEVKIAGGEEIRVSIDLEKRLQERE